MEPDCDLGESGSRLYALLVYLILGKGQGRWRLGYIEHEPFMCNGHRRMGGQDSPPFGWSGAKKAARLWAAFFGFNRV